MGKIIDISYWQGDVDFKKVKADGVELAILRASCGLSKDLMIDEYVKGCKENGIAFGVYHYLVQANASGAQTEANVLWNAAKKHKPAFWVLDFEDAKIVALSTAEKKKVAKAFVDQLRRNGAERIVIYTWEWLGKLLPDAEFGWAWRWYAAYGKNNGTHTASVKGCHLHQYTSTGKVNGIKTNVDMNHLMDGVTLKMLIGEKTAEAEKPKTEAVEKRKISRLLRQGSTGNDVKWLQKMLTANGCNAGTADGIFGPKTLAAVKKYQKRKKLTVDGIAGKNTITALGGVWIG